MKALLVTVILLLCPLCFCRAGENEVNVLAMGDWGRDSAPQRKVAASLADYVKAEHKPFHAMLLAGDNFYVPLEGGVNDPKWRTMFEDLYDPHILNFPFYPALGNHDYQLNRYMIEIAYSKANPSSRWKFPSRWYRVELPNESAPLVSVLMLDSNQPLLGPDAWNAELAWIKNELARPRQSKWLIVVCHHPPFTNGDHGDNGVLQNTWVPLFEQSAVDFFIAGHDHDLQHLQIDSLRESFLMVGGGGATTRPMRVDANRRGPFSKAANGYAHLSFTPDLSTVRILAADNELLHAFTRTRDSQIKVLKSTASDVAIPRTVKSISRPDLTTQPSGKATTKRKDVSDD
jgi:hypothetical protein